MNKLTKSTIALAISTLLSGAALANSNEVNSDESASFFGNLRVGYINAEDDAGNNSEDSSAIGVKLGYLSSSWNGLSAGGTLYSTQELFSDDNGDYFASDGSSYAILGEAFVQGNFGKTEIKAGRFELDTPHADTDDIRMIPNTFSCVLLTNTDLKDTTLYVAHLDKWAGVDTDKPEKFTDMNNDDGINILGAVYEGFEYLALQSWYYQGSNFADLFYIDATYEIENLTFGLQFGSQYDDTSDNTGPNGEVYGVMASYTINDFTINGAINTVSGTVTNGFGGGPFFTSAADHTIDGALDQNAVSAGVDYTGIDNLTLSLLHVDFDKGADETDFVVNYDFGNDMAVEVIYHHMHDDGKMLLAMFNIAF